MKIVFITPVTPFVDGGTSAHIYHLTLGRSKDVEVVIYTFNNNKRTLKEIKDVERQLNVRIKQIKMPKWIGWFLRFPLSFFRVFLPFPIYYYLTVDKQTVKEIEEYAPDGIWVYGEELGCVIRQFPNYRRVHTLPDSEAMYFYRMLQQRFVTNDTKSYWKTVLMYRKYTRMEQNYENDSLITYHLVGEADAEFIRNNNLWIDARFIRHPHYHILNPDRHIQFHQPKIKLLIAGQYNLYMRQEADLLVEQICNVNANDNENYLRKHYSITFLGKGWEKHVEALKGAGYEVSHITFAENYQEELVKHDIQITPIAIGTGTKGKVLDALANGLMVVGTPYARENIAVKNGESCIEYKHPEEVIDVLMDIPKNIQKYEQIAEEGRKQVLTLHNRSVVSQQLFGVFQEKS